jgi:hypothetical protein
MGVSDVAGETESTPRRSGFLEDPFVAGTWVFACTAALVLGLGLLVAIVLPYGEFDAMAYSVWSRLIGLHWPHLRFSGVAAVQYQRPLFYVLQGDLWAALGFHQWLGRLLSFAFSCVLVGSVAWTAARVVGRDRRFAGTLTVLVVLISAPFERYAAAGMSDVPVAAMVALTGAILVTARLGRMQAPLAGAGAALSVLAKPSSLGALLGLGLAVLAGPRAGLRRRSIALAALAAGTGLGLLYDLLQASYMHLGLPAFLGSGIEDAPYYEHLASVMRRTMLLEGSWLGPDLRLLLAFAILYALGRLLLPHRPAVTVALPGAWLWAWLGPHLAGAHGIGAVTLGVDRGVEQAGVVALGLALLLSLGAPDESVPDRLTLARALLWASPAFVSWAWKAAYDTRLLAPAWPALFLLVVLSLLPAFAGARALRPWLVAVPALAAVTLAIYAIYGIDGLGQARWQSLRAVGVSGLGDTARLRKLAVGGDFSAELDALAPQIGPREGIVSIDQRLAFLYVGQVDVSQPRTCADLSGHRIFVLLESDEVQTQYGTRATSPAFWKSCTRPSLTLVGDRPGAFAVFVTWTPRPQPGGCGASPTTGLLVQFGQTFPTRVEAEALLAKVTRVGFVQARVDQLGCVLYRVVYPRIPSATVGKAMIREARTANLEAHLVQP